MLNIEVSILIAIYLGKNTSKLLTLKLANVQIFLGKCPKFVRKNNLKIYVFIKPYMEYSIITWGGTPKTRLNKVSRSLKKAVSIMMFKNKYESTKPSFEYLNIVPFDINLKLQHRKFMKQLSLDLNQKVLQNISLKIH